MNDFYSIPVTLNDGHTTTMADWAGHALLIVNTASQCGYTEQYDSLEYLFQEYAPRGFFVLAMPCNQFGGQEPGSDEDIAAFLADEHPVSFPVLQKALVNGASAHPLFQYLKGDGPDIEWNFEKFLVSPEGDVVARFKSSVDPEDSELIKALEAVLPI